MAIEVMGGDLYEILPEEITPNDRQRMREIGREEAEKLSDWEPAKSLEAMLAAVANATGLANTYKIKALMPSHMSDGNPVFMQFENQQNKLKPELETAFKRAGIVAIDIDDAGLRVTLIGTPVAVCLACSMLIGNVNYEDVESILMEVNNVEESLEELKV